MTVKDCIEAGHYPLDSKGRALVPTTNGGWTATIVATDGPPGEEIIGFGPNSIVAWNQDGVPSARTGEAQYDTLQECRTERSVVGAGPTGLSDKETS